ncbi:MAG: hypothetical protein GF403_05955 [Candidatus Coatesbacteria bacterium]|nr:hypothetical protein [Candidatus Coatesbacteria bacterium]
MLQSRLEPQPGRSTVYPVFLRDIPIPFSGGETFTIYWYGVWFMTAILTALVLFIRRNKRMLGVPSDDTLTLAVIVILAGLIGAKLLTIFTRFEEFSADPGGFLFGRAYFSVFGGVLGGGVALWLVTRRSGPGFLGFADSLAACLPLAQALGRQGCFAAGCCWGKPTDAWWGVTFTHPDSVNGLKGVPLIPTQLIESGLNLLLFIGILILESSYKKRRQGTTFLVYGLGYGVIRFVMDFLRADPQVTWLGLSTNQWAVIVGFALIGLAVWKLLPKARPALEVYSDPPRRVLFGRKNESESPRD